MSKTSSELQGKVAVITGGSRGLGLAIARTYAQAGAAVVIASRSQASVEKAVAELQSEGAQVAGLSVDVANPAQVADLRALALDRFGQLDIWVNNAGLSAPFGPTVSVEPDRFVSVVNTNILGTYHGSMTAMQHFLGQNQGKLINLLGMGSDKPIARQNAYASSKAWIRNFTLALAEEYKETGIGIFAFNPGLVLTEMIGQVQAVAGFEEKVRPLETVTRLWANPADVPAAQALWLASAATDGKTGLEKTVLTRTAVVSGIAAEGVRRLLRRPSPTPPLEVESVPSAV